MVALLIAIVVVVVAIVVVLRLLLAELARVSAVKDAQARNLIERPSVTRPATKASVSRRGGATMLVEAQAEAQTEAARAKIDERESELEEQAEVLAREASDLEQQRVAIESRADDLERFARRLEAKAVEIETKESDGGTVPSFVDAPRKVRTRDILKLRPVSRWQKIRAGFSLMAMVALLGATTAALLGALVLLVAVALERTLS